MIPIDWWAVPKSFQAFKLRTPCLNQALNFPFKISVKRNLKYDWKSRWGVPCSQTKSTAIIITQQSAMNSHQTAEKEESQFNHSFMCEIFPSLSKFFPIYPMTYMQKKGGILIKQYIWGLVCLLHLNYKNS